MKKKFLKVIIILLLAVFLSVVLFFANAFYGNPISKLLAKRTAEKHLWENYSNDYVIDEVFYNFKNSDYHVHIVSKSQIDGNFTLIIGMDGKLFYDTYEADVLEHGNVEERLWNEYWKNVDAVFDSEEFPYKVDIGYGDLSFDVEYSTSLDDNAISRAELENEKIYDVNAIGATNGEITLYVESEEVNVEKMSEVLLTTKNAFDEAGIRFCSISLTLEYPRNPDGTHSQIDEALNIINFKYSDIYEEELYQRVQKAITETAEYYAELDKSK